MSDREQLHLREIARLDTERHRLKLRVAKLEAALSEACDLATAAAYNHDKPRNYWDAHIDKLRKVGSDG